MAGSRAGRIHPGCRRSDCNDPTSDNSNFSGRERNCPIVTGVSIFGSHTAPHCLMASIATCCHLSRSAATAAASRCVATRSVRPVENLRESLYCENYSSLRSATPLRSPTGLTTPQISRRLWKVVTTEKNTLARPWQFSADSGQD